MQIHPCLRSCSWFLALSLLPATALAETRFVNAGSTTGADDGTSWSDAFRGSDGLRRALLVAGAGDQIWVAQGTYFPTPTAERSRSFVIGDDLSIYGGFAGEETELRQRDPAIHETILSGDLAGDDANGNIADNSLHVVSMGTALIDGLTITGGNANAASGAGIDAVGYVRVRNCAIRGNRCGREGGGLFLAGDGLIEDTRFEDNSADLAGGAVHLDEEGSAEFFRCRFLRNQAPRGSAMMLTYSYSARVTSCLFTGNVATTRGTIYLEGPNNPYLFLGGSTLAANSGGGLHNESAEEITVTNSILYSTGGISGAFYAATLVTYSCVDGGYPGTGNIGSDPQFVDAGGGNFRLKETSPCIDAAATASPLTPSAGYDLDRTARREDVASIPDTGPGPAPHADMGAYETPGALFTLACRTDSEALRSCPCGNEGSAAEGCRNSQFRSGYLEAYGTASPDTVSVQATGLPWNTTCVLLQGNAVSSTGFLLGDGVRCVGGALKRMASQAAPLSTAVFPAAGDPSLSTRSAALGDPIAPGTRRHYQVWYRDPNPSFCPLPTGGTSNLTSGITVYW